MVVVRYVDAHLRVRGVTKENIAQAEAVWRRGSTSLSGWSPGIYPEVFSGDAP